MQSTPDNSFESVIKKLQKIYQMQQENDQQISQEQNEILDIPLDGNWFKGTIGVGDTKDITITPTVDTALTSDKAGIMTPIDVNYTYHNAFTLPKKLLGFLGFENYWQTNGSDTLSAGSIWTGNTWTPDIYEIIADGTTVWKGPNPPQTYMDLLDFASAKNALYSAPAWNMIVPNNSVSGAPGAGTYRVCGYMAFDNCLELYSDGTTFFTSWPYGKSTIGWVGTLFLAHSVTNISGGMFTGNGMLVTYTGKSAKQIAADMPSGGNVPAFTTSSVWPQPWQNPNILIGWFTSPNNGIGIPAVPGQFCLYTSGSWDGTAIYQSYYPQFITPNFMFEGITFEAQMPSPGDFAAGIQAAGFSAGDATAYGLSVWWQIYMKHGNDLGGGATNGPGGGKGATIANAFNDPGGDWGSVRTPGDMYLTGIPPQAQTIAFNLMWANYVAGTHPSWLAGSSGNYYDVSAKIQYGVTKTYSMDNMRLLFLNASQQPGGEVSFPGGDQTIYPIGGSSDPHTGIITNIFPLPFGQSPYLSGMWSSLVSSLNTSGSIIVDSINPSAPGGSTGAITSCSIQTRGANYMTQLGLPLTGGASINLYSVTSTNLDLDISSNIHSGALTSVALQNGQGGYGFAVGDLLTIIGGSGKGGTCRVASLQATTPATITFNAGTPAVVDITAVNNFVTVVNLVSGGTGYFIGATVAIKQGGYHDATVTVTGISAGGVITSLVLTTPGTNYKTATGLNLATAGVISDITLINAGTGYGQGQILPITQTGGNGAYLIVNSVVGNGVIKSVSLLQGGVGYTSITDASQALAMPPSGTIGSLTLVSAGSGYDSQNGLIVNPGPITAALLAGGGTGYTVGQVIQIPQTISLKYVKAGYQAFYDPTFTTQLFVQNIVTNPNVGRPDQHEGLQGYLALGQSLYEQTSINTSVAIYYFPYTNVELKVNADPYPKEIPLNTAVLDNTFDPCFIRLNKSTDVQERWGVVYYYSCIVMSPSVYQSTKTYKQWDDVTQFYFVQNSPGYITCGQEGKPPFDIGGPTADPLYADRSGPSEITSGPGLYTDSVPNTVSHTSQDVQIYYPKAVPLKTRVKVCLKTPDNWSQVLKFNRETR